MSTLRSPLKTLIHPTTGRQLKTGRRRPAPCAERRMHLPASAYLRRGDLITGRPQQTRYRDKASVVLRQVLMNDQLGCCTVSGMFHIEGSFRANAGLLDAQIPNALVGRVYERSGWVPGQPSTDQGWDEVSALESWHTQGLGLGGTIAGWLSADSNNPEEMRTLVWLFENLYFGFELPSAWTNAQMPSRDGFVWDLAGAPDPDDGHCVVGVDFADTDEGIVFDTWGLIGLVTFKAIAEYGRASNGGEVHCVISTDALVKATQKAPSGFDWPALVNDFNSRGGNVGPLAHMIA